MPVNVDRNREVAHVAPRTLTGDRRSGAAVGPLPTGGGHLVDSGRVADTRAGQGRRDAWMPPPVLPLHLRGGASPTPPRRSLPPARSHGARDGGRRQIHDRPAQPARTVPGRGARTP